ncbi:MAG: PQQ-binding-like beta-propeller repeat protein [Planctomycetota bacterium]
MSTDSNKSELRPLRAWIPALLVVAMIVCRFIPGMIENAPGMIWMVSAFGPFLIGLGIVLWWLTLSRASWRERLVGFIGIIGCITGGIVLLDSTMFGAPVVVMTIPLGIAGFAIGSILTSQMLSFRRTLIALVLCLVGACTTALFKNQGVWGNFAFDVSWRWNETAEERLLAEKTDRTNQVIDAVSVESAFVNPEWPGFRGPNRDGTSPGIELADGWAANPLEEVWRVPVGPAWSSFAVAGDYLFTQEQRGDEESIVCYRADNGEEVWASSIESRFFEALGGLGPRATPSIAAGVIFALGAEGDLLKLDATTGETMWETSIENASGRTGPPMWGYSSSPLVIGNNVVVHAGGPGDKGILAFDADSGELAWSAAAGEMSYSSPQILKVNDQDFIALLTEQGALFLDADGAVTLDYQWKHSGYRALQAQIVGGDKLLIPTGLGSGTRLVQLSMQDDQLEAKEIWTSLKMKPDFNDLLVHKGAVYGFDNDIFACIHLDDGKKAWKGGRYGKGQAILLPDSDVIAVITEKGQLVFVEATPDKHNELLTVEALSARTWNHPVAVGNRLYLRNAEEAVCYRLPVSSSEEGASETAMQTSNGATEKEETLAVAGGE